MLQASGICARIYVAVLVAGLSVFALSGWVSTGDMGAMPVWVSWCLRGLWAYPATRVLSLGALFVELWNRMTMQEVWS